MGVTCSPRVGISKSTPWLALLLTFAAGGTASASPEKVLVFVRDGSEGIGYMLRKEVEPMLALLKAAGLDPVVSSLPGKSFDGGGRHLDAAFPISAANVGDYAGVLLPCVAAGVPHSTPAEVARILREAASAGKPIAAQDGAVIFFDGAGLLDGRRYALQAMERSVWTRPRS